jgi:hypothetical protein
MKINHSQIISILAIIGFTLIGIAFTEYDFNKIATKLFNVSLFLLIHYLYSKFWLTNNNDTDAKIYETANATAIYHGLLAVGIALTISL